MRVCACGRERKILPMQGLERNIYIYKKKKEGKKKEEGKIGRRKERKKKKKNERRGKERKKRIHSGASVFRKTQSLIFVSREEETLRCIHNRTRAFHKTNKNAGNKSNAKNSRGISNRIRFEREISF